MFDSSLDQDSRSVREAAKTGADHNPLAAATRSSHDLDHLAQLVADGRIPCPLHFEPPMKFAFFHRVAQLRRSRLMRIVARAIASDVLRAHKPTKEYTDNAEAKDL